MYSHKSCCGYQPTMYSQPKELIAPRCTNCNEIVLRVPTYNVLPFVVLRVSAYNILPFVVLCVPAYNVLPTQKTKWQCCEYQPTMYSLSSCCEYQPTMYSQPKELIAPRCTNCNEIVLRVPTYNVLPIVVLRVSA